MLVFYEYTVEMRYIILNTTSKQNKLVMKNMITHQKHLELDFHKKLLKFKF